MAQKQNITKSNIYEVSYRITGSISVSANSKLEAKEIAINIIHPEPYNELDELDELEIHGVTRI